MLALGAAVWCIGMTAPTTPAQNLGTSCQWAIISAPTPNAKMHAAINEQNVIAISLGMAVFLY